MACVELSLRGNQSSLLVLGLRLEFDKNDFSVSENAKEDMRMSDDYPNYEGGLVYKQENDELEKRSERNRWDLDEDKKLAIKYLQRVVKKNEWGRLKRGAWLRIKKYLLQRPKKTETKNNKIRGNYFQFRKVVG